MIKTKEARRSGRQGKKRSVEGGAAPLRWLQRPRAIHPLLRHPLRLLLLHPRTTLILLNLLLPPIPRRIPASTTPFSTRQLAALRITVSRHANAATPTIMAPLRAVGEATMRREAKNPIAAKRKWAMALQRPLTAMAAPAAGTMRSALRKSGKELLGARETETAAATFSSAPSPSTSTPTAKTAANGAATSALSPRTTLTALFLPAAAAASGERTASPRSTAKAREEEAAAIATIR